jgi:DNA polymerase-3 subunit alpha/error-prone DNA polymerase
MGVKILPPDINKSDIRWKGRAGAMRVGCLSIKGLSSRTRTRIIAERKSQPYHDIIDFLERVQPDDPEVRSLIHAGAFDSLHPKESRASLLWELVRWQKSRSQPSGAGELFHVESTVPKPSFPPENKMERLRHEFSALGFLCDRHPMVLYADVLKKQKIVKAKDLPRFIGRHVCIAGLLITGKVVHTKHGEPMEFLTFEDETGLVEITFFPKTYRRFCAVLDRSRPFILYGKVEEDYGAITMTVKRVNGVPKRL